MKTNTRVLLGILVALSVPPLMAFGCGGSGKTSSAGNGSGGAGGTSGNAGGGMGGAGAADGGGGDSGQQVGCTGYPGQDPSTLPGAGCCSFGPSHCVPTSSIPPGLDNAFASCDGGLCVPDPIVQAGSEYVPTPCTADILGTMLAGVCLSQCITLVSSNPQKSLLPQATCGQGELCVPCVDPIDMTPTGACSITSLVCGGDGGTDAGPAEGGGPTCPYTGPPIVDPTQFPMCSPTCAGAHCVPAAIVPAAEQSQLAACPGGFCAPDTFIASAGEGVPVTCTSVAGAEGRCLSTCLPAIAAEAALLPVDVCASGEVCAPCYDPVAADPMAPTGACSLACDKPARPPTLLTCPWTGPDVINPASLPPCDSGGCTGAHCLPAAEVPPAVQSQLSPCNGNTGFCAPDPIIATGNNFIPPSCDPFPGAGAPGRCLSTCLPAVEAEAAGGTLVQSSCASGEYCVPCNDPFTGVSTGACSLGCDMPPAAPFTFPKCCNDGTGTLTGTCVPSAQVPSAQASSLNQSGNSNSSPCPASGAAYLCVPDEYLPAPYNSIPLEFCQATILDFCGTCVSQCVVNAELPLLTSSTCSAHHKCVECGIAPTTPGCPGFCSGGAVCGNSCHTNADCGGTCPVCSGGSCGSS